MTPTWSTAIAPLRQSILFAALLAVAGATGWIVYGLGSRAHEATRSSTVAPNAPDAFLENFVTVEMDGAGKPRRQIEASWMAYHADQSVELTNPRYVLYRAKGEPWHVRSERGHVSADGTVVWLLGRVDIWRNDASGARDPDIRTEQLKVLPDSDYAETTGPVTIRTPGSISTGVGMRAWLDENRFQLLSQVRTDVHRRPQR